MSIPVTNEFIYPFVHRSLDIPYRSRYLVVFCLVTAGAPPPNTPKPISSSFAHERRITAARLLGFFPVGKAPLRAAGKLAKPLALGGCVEVFIAPVFPWATVNCCCIGMLAYDRGAQMRHTGQTCESWRSSTDDGTKVCRDVFNKAAYW